jgi:hypothetical protein
MATSSFPRSTTSISKTSPAFEEIEDDGAKAAGHVMFTWEAAERWVPWKLARGQGDEGGVDPF